METGNEGADRADLQVDVVTSEAHTGAPAGVGVTPTAQWACPNNVFAQPRAGGDGYDLHGFTGGGVEVALCGRATLATAHALYELGLLRAEAPAQFHTQSDALVASCQADGAIEMGFPLQQAVQINRSAAPISSGLGGVGWITSLRLARKRRSGG